MAYPLHVLFYLLLSFALCGVGKAVYALFHPRERIDRETTARDNAAFAVPLAAYYLGILIALGAPLSAASGSGWLADVAAVGGWGLAAVLLLNLASLVKRRFFFSGLDLSKEILERKNLSAGIVVGGAHIANALLILGDLGGDGGWLPAAVFWVYGQLLLTLSAAAFPALLRYDLAREIRRDNRAIALTTAGGLIAVGNVMRLALAGSFDGWSAGFASITGFSVVGLAALFLIRGIADQLLLGGVSVRHELIGQEKPNAGVGFLIAVFYLGASFLAGWCL